MTLVMNMAEWIALGVERGWCSEPVCSTHDTIALTGDEYDQFELGYDPCVAAVRLYEQE